MFRRLFSWQKSIEFAKQIYQLTERHGLKTDFGLKDQMRRAAVSIPTNIAEGFERRSDKEYLNSSISQKDQPARSEASYSLRLRLATSSGPNSTALTEKAKFLSGSIANQMKAIASSGT